MDFLPKRGTCGVIYLYRRPDSRWSVVTWDGHCYNQHYESASQDEARTTAGSMLWAGGWPIVVCTSPTRKISPCVKIELTYADGSVSRLVGEAADRWLQLPSGHRHGSADDYPWKFDLRGTVV